MAYHDDPLRLTMTAEGGPGTPGFGLFGGTVASAQGGGVSAVSPQPGLDPLRARLGQLGQMYQNAPEHAPWADIKSRFGGPPTKAHVLNEMLRLRPLMQEERAQQQAEQKQRHEEDKQRLDDAKFALNEFKEWQKLSPAQQAAGRPALERLWNYALPRLGAEMTPREVSAVFDQPDLAILVEQALGVTPPTQRQAQQAQTLLGNTPREKWVDVAPPLVQRWRAEAEADVRDLLPVFVAGNGTPGSGYRERLERQGLLKPGAPIPYELFLRGVRDIANSDQPGLKEIASSRLHRDAFTALVKDEEFLTGLGVQAPKGTYEAQKAGGVRAAQLAEETRPEAIKRAAEKAGAVKREEVLAAGPTVGERTETILAGQGLRPATATAAQIEAARVKGEQEVTRRQIDVAREQGLNAAQIALTKEEDAQLNEKAPFWIHPQTGQVAKPSLTVRGAKAEGFVPVTQPGLTAVATAKAGLVQLKEYRPLITKLFPRATGNTLNDLVAVQGNRARLAVLRGAGDVDVKRLDALFGSIATLARATGDTANIAVAERNMLREFVVTHGETQESATAALDQAERILRAVVAAHNIPMPAAKKEPDEPLKRTGPAKLVR